MEGKQETYAEKIIKGIKEYNEEALKEKGNDIEKGFAVIMYDEIRFEEKLLIEEKIKMIVPSSFEEMEEEKAEDKYPGADKPEYIYTNKDTTVNLTFSIDNSGKIREEEIEKVNEMISKEVMRWHPGSKIEDKKTIKAKGKRISYFSFDVTLLDEDSYNVMFFMELEGDLIIGGLSCPKRHKKDWKPIFEQMLLSIREVEIDGE